jgi:hypothetical protein
VLEALAVVISKLGESGDISELGVELEMLFD